MHVDHRFGDLSNNLSVFKTNIAFHFADTELTDDSRSDSNEEPNDLVHNWFKNNTMHERNVTDLFSATAIIKFT